jgi:hypothetical protein
VAVLPAGIIAPVVFSVIYLLARRLLSCLVLLARREVSTEAELLLLRHENAVLPADRPGPQPAGGPALARGAVRPDPPPPVARGVRR